MCRARSMPGGSVDNKAQMERAMEIARGATGVRLASNEMGVNK